MMEECPPHLHHATQRFLSCGRRHGDIRQMTVHHFLRTIMTGCGKQLARLTRGVRAILFANTSVQRPPGMIRTISRKLRTQQAKLGKASQAAKLQEKTLDTRKLRSITSAQNTAAIYMAGAMRMPPKKLRMAEFVRNQ